MIRICSRDEIRTLVNANPNSLSCVILYEPDAKEEVADILPLCKEYIAMAFHDIEMPRTGYTEPRSEHIVAILEWSKNKDNIYVACKAGISRSSAVAFLIGCMKVSPEWAVREVLNSQWHIPNTRIIEIGKNELGPSILPEIRAYYERVCGWSMV